MAQLRKGTDFSVGMQVTDVNLDAHVDNAVLLPGAINDQVDGSVYPEDKLLLATSSSLKKATVAALHTGLVKADGTVAMTGDLTLANSSPANDSSAASKGYVNSQIAVGVAAVTDTTLVKRDGSRAMTGLLTLAGDPTTGLQAATKQYVDNRTPFTPVQQGGGDWQGSNKVYIGWSSYPGESALRLKVDYTDFGTVWPINITGSASSATNATNAVNAVNAQTAANGVPAGCIMAWPSANVPSGWLECNGQSTGGYSALAAVVGSNVPDLRGQFIRGWDHGRGLDPDGSRAVQSGQGDALQNITGTMTMAGSGAPNCSGSGAFSTRPGASQASFGGGGVPKYWDFSAANSPGARTSSETRPTNIALMYIIKT